MKKIVINDEISINILRYDEYLRNDLVEGKSITYAIRIGQMSSAEKEAFYSSVVDLIETTVSFKILGANDTVLVSESEVVLSNLQSFIGEESEAIELYINLTKTLS